MFGWFKKRPPAEPAPAEPMAIVFLNPLAVLLAGRERQKGSPLTEAEVLAVRDDAVCTQMPRSQAARFYAALDAQMPIRRLDPDRIWEEWQAIRGEVVWPQDAEPGAAADGGA